VDHFGFTTAATFKQRYFVCSSYWQKEAPNNHASNVNGNGNGNTSHKSLLKPSPIFFYTGNEANVELYVNATGLMWEHAEAFGALMIFAEHRFYGKSLVPAGAGTGDKGGGGADAVGARNAGSATPKDQTKMPYLSHELALADFAVLIRAIKAETKGAEQSLCALQFL
jgi:lysosomal Pro-X carboxypeptidase